MKAEHMWLKHKTMIAFCMCNVKVTFLTVRIHINKIIIVVLKSEMREKEEREREGQEKIKGGGAMHKNLTRFLRHFLSLTSQRRWVGVICGSSLESMEVCVMCSSLRRWTNGGESLVL
jgi:hypothetical protein